MFTLFAAPTGANLQIGCTFTWQLYAGATAEATHLTQVGAMKDYKEATCLALCMFDRMCGSADFNISSAICYHGTNANVATSEDLEFNHYSVSRVCCRFLICTFRLSEIEAKVKV